MPHGGAQSKHRRQSARRPITRRFVGTDDRESHARVEPARRRRRLRLWWQGLAMSQRDKTERRPAITDVSISVRMERENPRIALIVVSFIRQFEDSHEAVVQKRIVEPAID